MRWRELYLESIAAAGCLAVVCPAAGAAQQATAGTPTVAVAPQEPAGAIALPLPAGAEGSVATEQWVDFRGEPRLRNVTQPSLTPFLPPVGKATGAAVIIAPGGGFVQLAIEKEGWNVARWLADHGVAAFVLKYRLISPEQMDQAARAMTAPASAAIPSAPERSSGSLAAAEELRTYGPGAEDVRAAIRLVRARADEWGVDPGRVGAMGFSAGATLALSLATDPDPAIRPDFVIPIYAPAGRIAVPASAPPMFSAIAADDGLFDKHGTGLVQAWKEARRPVEFHLYDSGGHGFGVPGASGTTTTGMMDQLLLWLQARQIVGEQAGR